MGTKLESHRKFGFMKWEFTGECELKTNDDLSYSLRGSQCGCVAAS